MMAYVNYFLRKAANFSRRRKLRNRDFSIFSSNCNGACICHDLGLQFRSPFVNLWLSGPDFVKFLGAPKEYLSYPLNFAVPIQKHYPVARLHDITIYFEHYTSPQEAQEQWMRRIARINWDNLFVLMSDRDGCTEDVLQAFDALPYKNKVVFTHLPRPDIASAVYIPGFEAETQVGICSEFRNRWSGRTYYDAFDYVRWLNEGGAGCPK